MARIVLVLGGGAPNLTLMSGALAAFHDNGCQYDVVSMAGAGAVVGLCYLAPKGMTPGQALRNTMNFGVSDAIYSLFPINYKIFSKAGPLARGFRNAWDRFPPAWAAAHQYGMSPLEKLQSDMMLFAGAAATPSDTNYFSQSMCAHLPFVEQIVDFDRVQNDCSLPDLFLNSFCINTSELVEFERPQIDVHHFRAALSFPFLYAPYEIDGKFYYEGAAFGCLNLVNLAEFNLCVEYTTRGQRCSGTTDPDKFIVFDILVGDLIHPAKNIWDAYAQSIIVPLIADAAKEQLLFQMWLKTGIIDTSTYYPANARLASRIDAKRDAKRRAVPLLGGPVGPANPSDLPLDWPVPDAKDYHVQFPVPYERWSDMLDWSRSNLEALFDIGYQSGLDFLEVNGREIWG